MAKVPGDMNVQLLKVYALVEKETGRFMNIAADLSIT